MPENADTAQAPQIPDHTLVRCIGRGSYGEVWLGQSVIGTYRAVKIVQRKTFNDDRPYLREFEGIQRFEPVSRTHAGFVAILHVGRNEPAGYFYYVMEVADDVALGQNIDPATYKAKTLSSSMAGKGRLPLAECFRISLALALALDHLHSHGLIHRDIKPSNIIFGGGAPKFADIGLVTAADEKPSCVGSLGYMPLEGPGRPPADIYSLGKVFYELFLGKACEDYPELPSRLEDIGDVPTLMRINEAILKACDKDPRKRFPSAREFHDALAEIARSSQAVPPVATRPRAEGGPPHVILPERDGESRTVHPTHRVAILHKSKAQPDDHLLELLQTQLSRRGCEVFLDRHRPAGVAWVGEIENAIRSADAVIILLSAASVLSEMLAYEVELAHQTAQQQQGRPRLLPVRIRYSDPLPDTLGTLLHPLQDFCWADAPDDERLVSELARALETSQQAAPLEAPARESVGGAVPLDSRFYVERSTDAEFQTAINRRDSIVLVKGARQMGKTSLLARGLRQARHAGAQVVLTDFQKLNTSHLASIESFYLSLGEFVSEQLGLSVFLGEVWDERRSPNLNFERYLRRQVLGPMDGHLVWGLDEVDRLFTCNFGSEVFGLFRSWHNERALDARGPWSRLTLAMAYATEAHLFITDLNQSPFNVGTRLTLDDFTFDQVADLNRRYGAPLRTAAELQRFHALLGGQPYLVQGGLNELAAAKVTFAEFVSHAARDEGIFGDHLRRMLVLLAKDPGLTEVVRGILRGQPCPNPAHFYRLRSAGVMRGDSPHQVQPRCEIYASYLRDHL